MNTPQEKQPARTAAVPLVDGGQLVIVCPAWCEGHDGPAMYPSDVAHSSPEQPVTVNTAQGAVELLTVGIEHVPFSVTGSQRPYASVLIGGEFYRFDTAGLYALAAEIAEQAPAVLRAVADQLAAALENRGTA